MVMHSEVKPKGMRTGINLLQKQSLQDVQNEEREGERGRKEEREEEREGEGGERVEEREKLNMMCSSWFTVVLIVGTFIEIGKMGGGPWFGNKTIDLVSNI